MRQFYKTTYNIASQSADLLKDRMLNWANRFSIHLLLDSNSYKHTIGTFEFLLGVGTDASPTVTSHIALQNQHERQWWLGHVNYDYKNTLFKGLQTNKKEVKAFCDFFFFAPDTILYIERDSTELVIESIHEPDLIWNEIMECAPQFDAKLPKVDFKKALGKNEYCEIVDRLRQHIKDGDCYEINLCNYAYAEGVAINPVAVFKQLNSASPAPFSAYYKVGSSTMMCASPERYLTRVGERVYSQPIKGTARRSHIAAADEQIKVDLRQSIKERAENVMIVDLVRNDLAQSCKTGSIQVDELFGVYTFPHVHQLISTVSGVLKNSNGFSFSPIEKSFPMGSMTGAPKYKVMQLIEQYEAVARGLFSGSVGYITPDGDFDLNVVIRSLFYNAGTQHLCYQTGGAITWDSVPEQEWEEMLLKGEALERLFR